MNLQVYMYTTCDIYLCSVQLPNLNIYARYTVLECSRNKVSLMLWLILKLYFDKWNNSAQLKYSPFLFSYLIVIPTFSRLSLSSIVNFETSFENKQRDGNWSYTTFLAIARERKPRRIF